MTAPGFSGLENMRRALSTLHAVKLPHDAGYADRNHDERKRRHAAK